MRTHLFMIHVIAPKHCAVFVSALLWLSMSCRAESPIYWLSAVTLDRSGNALQYVCQEKVHTLSIYHKQRSKGFKYQGAQTLRFFSECVQLGSAGRPQGDVLAEVQLPDGGGHYLLIFAPVSETTQRSKVLVIPDSWETFPAGTCRFLNLSAYNLALKLEGEVRTVAAQDYTDVEGAPSSKAHQQAVMVSLPVAGKPRRVFEGLLRFGRTQRMLYIVFPKEGRRDGRVKFIGIPQSLPQR